MQSYTSGTQVNPRTAWAARPSRAGTATNPPPREAFVHITDTPGAASLTTGAQRATAMRQIQRFHQDDRGWADIGYHYVVFQPHEGRIAGPTASQDIGGRTPGGVPAPGDAMVFAGRSVSVVPAAQLGHNTGTLAIAVFGTHDDRIYTRTLYVIEELIKRHPTVAKVGGHRDVVATDCPGDRLYSLIPRVARASGAALFAPARG